MNPYPPNERILRIITLLLSQIDSVTDLFPFLLFPRILTLILTSLGLCSTGFKKDQLKVHINNRRIIRISGECPVDKTRWKRFTKEIKVPKKCNTDAIQAKFDGSLLHIIMPKKITPLPEQDKSTTTRQSEKGNLDCVKEKAAVNEPNKLINYSTSHKLGAESSLLRFKVGKKVAISVIVTVAVLVAIGVYYVTYKYWHSHIKLNLALLF